MGIVDSTWGRLSGLVKTILVVGVALITILLLWLYSAKAINGISGWWYPRGTAQAHKEIESLKNDAAQAKAVAEEALKELALEKERGAAEKKKREIAEGILSDRTKTTNEKIAAYEAAMGREPDVSPPADTDALCKRAARAGIKCE